jgi:hypothetical protein
VWAGCRAKLELCFVLLGRFCLLLSFWVALLVPPVACYICSCPCYCCALVRWYQLVPLMRGLCLLASGDCCWLLLCIVFLLYRFHFIWGSDLCLTLVPLFVRDCHVGAGYLKSGYWLGLIRGKCVYFSVVNLDSRYIPNYVPWYTGTGRYQ